MKKIPVCLYECDIQKCMANKGYVLAWVNTRMWTLLITGIQGWRWEYDQRGLVAEIITVSVCILALEPRPISSLSPTAQAEGTIPGDCSWEDRLSPLSSQLMLWYLTGWGRAPTFLIFSHCQVENVKFLMSAVKRWRLPSYIQPIFLGYRFYLKCSCPRTLGCHHLYPSLIRRTSYIGRAKLRLL